MTDRITQELVQGTPEWQHFRLSHCGASEAAAMLGLSPNTKRTELLHVKFTGNPKEFSDFVQERILDHGHAVEALARPLLEEDLGEDLYPVTYSLGKLSASLDGITMDEETAFEHKQWNAELAAAVRSGDVPDSHMPQCQQILLVSGAKRVIFVVSDGTRDRFEATEVLPDPAWFERIRAGWEQFEKDLAEYVPIVDEAKPVGKTPETLPALRIELTGKVTASNLIPFKEHAIAVIGSINRDLKTDQHFADAEKAVKWCEEVESRLKAAKQHALSQTADIDALFSAIDEINAYARETRLALGSLVTKRKAEIKDEIIVAGRQAYLDHVAALKTETGGAWVTLAAPDFAAAAKSKRSVASIRDAVDTLLANAKIVANESAKRIRDNIAYFDKATADHAFLFHDRLTLVTKDADDLKLVIGARIDKHKADEEGRRAADRERIRKEEAERLAQEQREAQEAEDVLIKSIWGNARRIEANTVPYIEKAIRTFESAASDFENDPRPRVAEAIAAARTEMRGKLEAAKARADAEAAPPPVNESEPRDLLSQPAAAPAPALAARTSPPATVQPLRPSGGATKRKRPTDDDIIESLCTHFGAPRAVVIGWLGEMDLPALAA